MPRLVAAGLMAVRRPRALRQYRFCVQMLRLEFDTAPEEATTAL